MMEFIGIMLFCLIAGWLWDVFTDDVAEKTTKKLKEKERK